MRRKAQADVETYSVGSTAVWGILVLLDFLGGFMQKKHCFNAQNFVCTFG